MTKTNSSFIVKVTGICTIMELKECKHMKNVRYSQSCILMKFFIKAKVLACQYR